TFWYTTEYYAVDGLNDLTRIGSFKYAECTAFSSTGTLQGTVTNASTSAPLVGAVVTLGSRSTTTDGSGFYQFASLPAGARPSLTHSVPGVPRGHGRLTRDEHKVPTHGASPHSTN